jgi:hypothetical protein
VPERGLAAAQEAVQRARQLGDDVLLGASLALYLLLHLLREARPEPAQAGPLITEALACTQRSGDQFVAYTLHNIAGSHALLAGDIPAARAYLERAQAMRAAGHETFYLSINMGWVLRQDNDLDGTRTSFEAALRLSRRNGDRFGIGKASMGLACLAADAGNWHRAAVLHGVAQALLDRIGLPWEELEGRYRQESLDQVRAHLSQTQFDQAHAKGMALGINEALDLAIGKTLPA